MKLWHALLIAAGTAAGLPAAAQEPDLQRAFLSRYLDCAEAPGDRARLACFDALLADIPAWLDATLPPPGGAAGPEAEGPVPGVADAEAGPEPEKATRLPEAEPSGAQEAPLQPVLNVAPRPRPKA